MEHFIIKNNHLKYYNFLITDWNDGAADRKFKHIVVEFDHNKRVSALAEQLRQDLFVKMPTLCMTGEIYLHHILERCVDNEALLKDAILSPEKRFIHANCYLIPPSPNVVSTFPTSNLMETTFVLTHHFSSIQRRRMVT